MKKLLIACLFLMGCNAVNPPSQWPRTIHPDIVIGKYTKYECLQKRGTWIIAETSVYADIFEGCIEVEVKKDCQKSDYKGNIEPTVCFQ